MKIGKLTLQSGLFPGFCKEKSENSHSGRFSAYNFFFKFSTKMILKWPKSGKFFFRGGGRGEWGGGGS